MIRIDMPMPTCCEDCFAQAEYYNPRFDETEYSCGINGKNLGAHSRHDWGEWHCDRPEWCPMKEQEMKWIPVSEHYPIGRFNHELNEWFYWCPGCNGHVDKDDKFCRHCGKQLDWEHGITELPYGR